MIALDLQHLHVCSRALHVGTVYGYIVWLTATEYIEESVLFLLVRTFFSSLS